MSIVLLCMGFGLAALALHPFSTYPLSLLVLARLRPRPLTPAPGALPERVAICVCAYNEERVIGAKIDNMLAMREVVPGLEILVYVDAATDRTAEIARRYGSAVRLVVGEARKGKSHGMNTLVPMTDADVVIFTDANVMFEPNTVPRLLQPFADATVGCVCGHLIYTSSIGGVTAEIGCLYWWLEEVIKELESRIGSIMGADGSIFAIRRALHRPPPADLCDDMFVSLSILLGGHRIVRAADAMAYEEAASRPADEFRRKIRIGCMGFNVHRLLREELGRLPPLARYQYVSHKLLRWFAVYLLLASTACLVAGLAIAHAWLPLVALVLGLLAIALSGSIAKAREVLSAFVATGVGVWHSARGERFQVWTPVSSARQPDTADV
jgi:cellulose synthase/poly-beta-1,6-N-acetylglucosamine synthase-like glycosyltransferase